MDQPISLQPNDPYLYLKHGKKQKSYRRNIKFNSNYRSPAYHRRSQDHRQRSHFENEVRNSNFQPYQSNGRFFSNYNSQRRYMQKASMPGTTNSNDNQPYPFTSPSKQKQLHDQITNSPRCRSKYTHSQNDPNEKSNNPNQYTARKKINNPNKNWTNSNQCAVNKKIKKSVSNKLSLNKSPSTTSIFNDEKSISDFRNKKNEKDSFVIDHNLSDSNVNISTNYTSRKNLVFPISEADFSKENDLKNCQIAISSSANSDLNSLGCEVFTTKKDDSLPYLDNDEKNVWSCNLDSSKITNPEGASQYAKNETQDHCGALNPDLQSESCSGLAYKSLESDKIPEANVLSNQSKLLSDQENSSNQVKLCSKQVKLFQKLELIPSPFHQVDTDPNQPDTGTCINIDNGISTSPVPKISSSKFESSNLNYHPEIPSSKHNDSFDCHTPQTKEFSSEMNNVVSSPQLEISSTKLNKIHPQIPRSAQQKPCTKVNQTFTFSPQAEISNNELDTISKYPISEILYPSSSEQEISSVDKMETSSSQLEIPSTVDNMSTLASSTQPEMPSSVDKMATLSSPPEITCIELDNTEIPSSSQPEKPSSVVKMATLSSPPEIPCIELDNTEIPSSSQPDMPCIKLDKISTPHSSSPEGEESLAHLDEIMPLSQQEELSGLPCGQKTIVSSPGQEDKGYEDLIGIVSQVSSFSPPTRKIESPYKPMLEASKNLDNINDLVHSKPNDQPIKPEPTSLHNSLTSSDKSILSISDLPEDLFGSGNFFFQSHQNLNESNLGIPKEFFKGQQQMGEAQKSPENPSLSSLHQKSSVNIKQKLANSLTKSCVQDPNESEECDINIEFHDCFKKLSSMPGKQNNVKTIVPLSSPTLPFTSTQYTNIPHKLPAFSLSPLQPQRSLMENLENVQLSPAAKISPIHSSSQILKHPENKESVGRSVRTSTELPLSPKNGNLNTHKPCHLVDYTQSQEIFSESQPVVYLASVSNNVISSNLKSNEVGLLNEEGKAEYRSQQLQEIPKSSNSTPKKLFGSTHVKKNKVDPKDSCFELNLNVILKKVETMVRKKRNSCIKKRVGCWFDIRFEDVVNEDIVSSVRYRIPLLKFAKKTKEASMVIQSISEGDSGTLQSASELLPNLNDEKDEKLNVKKRFTNLPDELTKKGKSQAKLKSNSVPLSSPDIIINSESSQTHQKPLESKNKHCHVLEKKKGKNLYLKNEPSDSVANLEQDLPFNDSITNVLEELKTLCSNLVVLSKNCQVLDADTLSQMCSDVKSLKNKLKPVYHGLKLISYAPNKEFSIEMKILSKMTILWRNIRTLSRLCKTLKPSMECVDIKKQAKQAKRKIKLLINYMADLKNTEEDLDLNGLTRKKKTSAIFTEQEVELKISIPHSDLEISPSSKKRKEHHLKSNEQVNILNYGENDDHHVDTSSAVVTNKETARKSKKRKKKLHDINNPLLMSEEKSPKDGELKGKKKKKNPANGSPKVEVIECSEIHYRSSDQQLSNNHYEKWSSTYKSIRLSKNESNGATGLKRKKTKIKDK